MTATIDGAGTDRPAARAAARLEERAEADLARMQAARERRKKPDERKHGKATTAKPKPTAPVATGGRYAHVELQGPGDAEAEHKPGLYWVPEFKNEEGQPIDGPPMWLASPFRVVCDTRDSAGEAWGLLLVFEDRDKREHRVVIPKRALVGRAEMAQELLLDAGLQLNPAPEPRRRFVEYLNNADPKARAVTTARTGWHGSRAFVMPDGAVIGDEGGEPVILQGAQNVVACGVVGTLEGWRDHVAKPCAGNTRLVLAIALAFAAPCLRLLGMEGGGVHLRGVGSSTGKSTAQHCSASVVGSWEGYSASWKSTDAALESLALSRNDLPLILDELGEASPKSIGAAAYMFGNGKGKSRSHRDGTARPIAQFLLLFLSSGERSLASLIAEAGQRAYAGQEVRLIDLPAEPLGSDTGVFERVPEGMAPGEFSNALKAACADHHGHAMRTWLQHLTNDPQRSANVLRALHDEALRKFIGPDAGGQARRVAQRFAVIAAAGELATAHGITGWSTGEAQGAALACYRAWVQARGGEGNQEPAQMVAAVRAYLQEHGESRCSDWDRADDRHAPRTGNRVGWYKRPAGEAQDCHFYIYAERFRDEVCKGFDHRAVCKALAAVGALKSAGPGEYSRSERMPNGVKARVYVITPAIFECDTAPELTPVGNGPREALA